MAIDIDQARRDAAGLYPVFDRHPVIVKTEYAPMKYSYGVQYWTHDMIKMKRRINHNKSVSVFIESVSNKKILTK